MTREERIDLLASRADGYRYTETLYKRVGNMGISERAGILATALEETLAENELLRILADGCPEHTSYRAKRKVVTTCETCNRMWKAREVLNAQESSVEEKGEKQT